ncbi:hypothetical protein SK128_010604 [Halocaridina rubra]|uniref:Uncharacterized protein n=1 Tax=Halocaridina rubra TaxID=373956 RepID=A0AAN9ADZ9_HALRR
MLTRQILLAALCLGICSCMPRQRRDSTPSQYELPGNATSVLEASLQTGFR